MSRILFLADLHGNMPATLALEKELEKIKPDDIWFLGIPENHGSGRRSLFLCQHSGNQRRDLIYLVPAQRSINGRLPARILQDADRPGWRDLA